MTDLTDDKKLAKMQKRLGMPIVTKRQIADYFSRNREPIMGALDRLNGKGSCEMTEIKDSKDAGLAERVAKGDQGTRLEV